VVTHAAESRPSDAQTLDMDDRRVAWLRARIAAHRSEVTRLEVEVDAVLAARVGVSQWRSNPMLFRGWAELPKELLAKVLELLQWQPAACGTVRAVCSAWGDVHDEYCRKLDMDPSSSAAVMKDKLAWFPSVTEVYLEDCAMKDASAVLAELGSMRSLRSLSLPASCAERAVDAEAVCGITTLTSLRFEDVLEYDDDGYPVKEEVGAWVLDLSTLTTLTSPRPRAVWRRDGQASAGAEQPDGPRSPQPSLLPHCNGRGAPRTEQPHRSHHSHPPRLRLQRHGRGAALTEQPHCSLHPRPPRLRQRHSRGEAGAAHRHPQPDDYRLMMRTLPPLLPSRPSAHAPQCEGVERLAWRAANAWPCNLSCNTTVLHDQPPRCTAMPYTPHLPHHPPSQ
jgi:hypothetical protein